MTHKHNAITDTWKYTVLHGMVRYTFIYFGLFAKPNLCPPLTQNSGDATVANDNVTDGQTEDNIALCMRRMMQVRHIDLNHCSPVVDKLAK